MKSGSGLLKIGLISACMALISPPTSSEENTWLPPGSHTTVNDPELLEITNKGVKFQGPSLLGKLLFNSPSILGEKAIRLGLSCNSCHPSGHVNTSFYISGLSDKPGDIDLSNSFWNKKSEDHIFNPIPIPTLRGARDTAPYGSNVSLPSLAAFTRHVIVDEFDGPEPDNATLNSLISYMNLLEKETSPDKTIQGKAALTDLIALLRKPIDEKNAQLLERNSDLVLETLGRQLNDKNAADLTKLATSIKKMRRLMGASSLSLETQFKELQSIVNSMD